MSEKLSFDDGCCGQSVLSRLASNSSNIRGASSLSRRAVQIPIESVASVNEETDENNLVDEFLTSAVSSKPRTFTSHSDEWSSEFLNLMEADRNLWTNDFRAFLDSQRLIERQINLTAQPDNAERWAVQFEKDNREQNLEIGNNFSQMNEAWSEASNSAGEFGESALFAQLEQEWEKTLRNYQEDANNQSTLEAVWDEELRNTDTTSRYIFSEQNPFEDEENALQKGVERLEAGDLANAVLLFEEAVRQSPSSAEAWQYLGIAQSENENDVAAIQAFNSALQINPNHLESLLTLSASYTNEGDMKKAVATLKSWLQRNSKFSDLVLSPDTRREQNPSSSRNAGDSSLDIESIFSYNVEAQECLSLFQSANHRDPNDVNVLTALGILHCVRSDYKSAAEAFRRCVELSPQNALLWNRLGACLANGDHSEEAISAYRNALNLRPGYIRARFNLGVACKNLRSHREAIEHFLVALNMQSQGIGPRGEGSQTSAVIWSNLVSCLHLTGVSDQLQEAVSKRDLSALNRYFHIEL